jgi:hypothetical protein
MRRLPTAIASLALWTALGGCGSRNSYWDQPALGTSYGLANGVALLDNSDHRVVMLTALDNQELKTVAFPIGHNAVSTTASPDNNRLFVLSTGDWPPRTKKDENPSLTVIDASSFDTQSARYQMSAPLPKLAIDPLGEWAVAYAGKDATTSFVQNANEIVVFDLRGLKDTPVTAPPPIARTIRSFGGTPQRLTFTPSLCLPNGSSGSNSGCRQRRLLIIETDIDFTLLDLEDLSLPEVTVALTSGTNAKQVTPAGVVVDGFDSNNAADARIALRADNNTNVFTYLLGSSSDPSQEYTPVPNEIDVGGVPTDIAFVHTGDGGLRVAALVPTKMAAVLADPDTSVTTPVALPAPFTKLSLITNVLASETGTDVAMLWNSGSAAASGIAFWMLGNTVGKPYFSIESIAVSQPIQTVDDVANYERLKVLETQDQSGFFVLDLISRTASPLQTMSRAAITIAPDGQRLWAFAPGGTDLAKLNFSDLNPVPVETDTGIDAAYDVARSTGRGRSLIAIHKTGGVAATVFDALDPKTASSRHLPALLLEGP